MKSVAAAIVALTLLASCRDDSVFTLGRDLDVCDANYPSCAGSARCVLDEAHYITGSFPSGRRFLFRTMGEESVKFQIYLTAEKAAGTVLRLVVYEPGCGNNYRFDTNGTDLFRAAGTDGILQIPMHVTRAGDHLVELLSDSYCDYTLLWGQVTQ